MVKVNKNSKTGTIVSAYKSNPEFGYVVISEVAPTIDGNGFLRKNKKVSTIKGAVEDLKEMNYQDGQELAGQIVIRESLEPTNPNNPEQDIKYAGDTGVICMKGGQPIYRTSLYTLDMSLTDEYVAHDNTEEIKQAQEAKAESSANLAE